MLNLFINSIIIIFFLFLTIKLNRDFFKIENNVFSSFLVYHLALTFIYVNFFKIGDWETFLTLEGHIPELSILRSLIGSHFINSFIYLLKLYSFNNISIIILFSLISFFGIVIFIKNLMMLGVEKKICYILLFMPGINFWTCPPGKDGLTLLFLSLFFFFFLNKKVLISFLFLLLIFFIRPHIGVIFMISFFLFQFITSKNKIYSAPIIALFVLFIDFFINLKLINFNFFGITNYFIKIGDNSNGLFDKIQNQIISLSNKYDHTDSYYESSNIYINMFEYILFPLDFILKNNSIFINLSIMLEIFTFVLIGTLLSASKVKSKIDKNIITLISCCLLVYLLIMPNVFFNYGINSRQKWMILPFLIYFLFSFKNFLSGLKK